MQFKEGKFYEDEHRWIYVYDMGTKAMFVLMYIKNISVLNCDMMEYDKVKTELLEIEGIRERRVQYIFMIKILDQNLRYMEDFNL